MEQKIKPRLENEVINGTRTNQENYYSTTQVQIAEENAEIYKKLCSLQEKAKRIKLYNTNKY